MKQLSRRKFIGETGKATLAGSLLLTLNNNNKSMEQLFIHHVYFWLNNPGSAADRDKLIEGLHKLSTVKTIQQFHIGLPANTNRPVIEKSYAVSWCCFFETAANQDSYQTDPIHLKFVEDYSHLWKKVIVYDSIDI